jgi:hypothetical protein
VKQVGPSAWGNLGLRLSCGGCSGLRGPSGPWQTHPRCAMCWMSSPSGSTRLPRRRITSRSGAGSCTGCWAMRSGSGGCQGIRSARETCLRAGRNRLGRRMRSPWAGWQPRAAPLCVRQLLPPPLSGLRRVKSIACGDTGRPEQDDRRAATCATGTVVSRSYSAICRMEPPFSSRTVASLCAG